MDIALALGGGGARGLAHIGVLRAFEREGVRVRAIAGTSMGGIIAAAYACGMSPDTIQQKAAELEIRGLLQLRPTGPALFGLEKVQAWLVGLFGELTFEELPIPLAVTAVDLAACREVVIRTGPLVAGVMATMALPGIFPPQILGEHRLVDGATLDPVPVRPVRELHNAPVVAVVLSPEQSRWPETRSPSPFGDLPVVSFVARLGPLRALEIFQQAMEITLRMHTELHLTVDKPEVIIRPEVWDVGLFDSPSLETMSALGEAAANEAMPAIRSQFAPHRRLWRWIGQRTRRWTD
ncbi:MAG: patatin-like phospholipase family protein [Anaerolineales bacterium]|nr:patatin-like phospholipase family protein [Anaerolineales bacterium]